MFALGLSLGATVRAVPPLSGTGLPPLPDGYAFLMWGGAYLLFDGSYLVAEAN